MKKTITILSIIITSIIVINTTGCIPSEVVAMKSGAQIWGENCVRCHNSASPETFSNVEWEIAGMHMRIRANLTADETKKVIEFLQSAN